MPEPDFHGLREAAADAARQPDFASVQRRAGRLRTRRYAATAGAATVLSVAVLLTGSALAANQADRGHSTAGDPGVAASDGPIDTARRSVYAVGGSDEKHLYAMVTDCADCERRLMASDDGGRSWSVRRTFDATSIPPPMGGLQVLDRHTVVLPPGRWLRPRPSGSAGAPVGVGELASPVAGPWRISTDGGVNWRDLAVSSTPAASALPGHAIAHCDPAAPSGVGEGCPIYAVDPTVGRMAPLATQPPLVGTHVAHVVSAAAGLWVQGYEPGSLRPAVAVSRDGGRTWSRAVFSGEPTAKAQRGFIPTAYLPWVSTADGRTAYAMFAGDGPPRVYRSTDGGTTWRRTNSDAPLSDAPLNGPQSWVTADGAHVVLDQPDGKARFLASPDGIRYAPLGITGPLASDAVGPTLPTMVGSRYLAGGAHTVYLSDDGRTWRPVLELDR